MHSAASRCSSTPVRLIDIGQIELVTPKSAESLTANGQWIFLRQPIRTSFMQRILRASLGLGEIRQGFVEQSNVTLNDEMVDMIVAQRGYQLNARVVQLADQLLETINNLRR